MRILYFSKFAFKIMVIPVKSLKAIRSERPLFNFCLNKSNLLLNKNWFAELCRTLFLVKMLCHFFTEKWWSLCLKGICCCRFLQTGAKTRQVGSVQQIVRLMASKFSTKTKRKYRSPILQQHLIKFTHCRDKQNCMHYFKIENPLFPLWTLPSNINDPVQKKRMELFFLVLWLLFLC